MDNSSLSFISFQAVSPKQWTAWVHLLSHSKQSVLNNGQFELTFVMFQVVSPKQWTAWVFLLSFQVVSPKQWTAWAYLSFSQKCHPLLYQKTRCHSIFHINIKVIIPRLGRGRNVDSLTSRYVGWRDVTQFLSQVSFPVFFRMTKCQKCHPQCVWSRDVTNQNVCFYKPSVYKYISKFPNVYSRSCFPFIYLHTTINTVVDNHFPQWNYSIP